MRYGALFQAGYPRRSLPKLWDQLLISPMQTIPRIRLRSGEAEDRLGSCRRIRPNIPGRVSLQERTIHVALAEIAG